MENLLNKEAVKRADQALEKFDQKLKIIVLKTTARTAIDAANSLNCEVGAIVKSLLFRTDNSFLLCLVSGDNKCSLNKLKKITLKKDVFMASPDEVKDQTGYTIGSVSPVGHLNSIEIFIDKVLEDNPENVEKYKNGKTKLLGFFIGEVMKATKGKANPGLLNQIVKKKLDN